MMRKASRNVLMFGSAAIALMGQLGAVLAFECEPSQDPSPAGEFETGINFYNETSYAMRVFWSDFEGFIVPYSDWLQPGESASFNTFVGHNWLVEVNTPDGAFCSSLISANDEETCQMRILYDGGIGYDAGFCNF